MTSAEIPAELRDDPDVMNDEAYQTNSTDKERGVDEVDTCRICRGEGSKEEPLFYPCKCSGSIKFVHQGCLMEWLSHSQKKHCELCKTSFRFTKLYHPQMPNTVPLPVFMHQAAIHTFKNFLTWARWHLVLFVWLGWVPWCMRTVWRGLFWIGDGGWINWKELEKQSTLAAQIQAGGLTAHKASPPNGFLSSNNATALEILSRVSSVIPPLWPPVSQTLNFTAGEPTVFRLTKQFLRGIFFQSSATSMHSDLAMSVNGTDTLDMAQRSSSWLSDVNFLRNLTRWSTLNNLVIDVLEGQLITLLVVFAFILVFLIREWVVQQQPAINMGIAFNAAFAAAEGNRGEIPAIQRAGRNRAENQNQADQVPNPPADDNGNDMVQTEGVGNPRTTIRDDMRPTVEHHQQERIQRQEVEESQNTRLHVRDRRRLPFMQSNAGEPSRPRSDSDGGLPQSSQRPLMPDRNAPARATEIRRALEEQSRASGEDWPELAMFMPFWERAGHKPSEVLRIIEEEGRSEELAWIVSVMRRWNETSTEGQIVNDAEQFHILSTETRDERSAEQRSDISAESGQSIGQPNRQQRQDVEFLRNLPSSHEEKEDHRVGQSNDNGQGEDTLLAGELFSSGPVDEPDVSPNKGKGKQSNMQSPFSDSSHSGENEAAQHLLSPNDLNSSDHLEPHDPSERADSQAEPSEPSTRGDDSSDSVPDMREQTSTQGQAAVAVNGQQNLKATMIEWLWGGVPVLDQEEARAGEREEDDEHVVRNVAEEAPFVPVAHGQLMIEDENHANENQHDPEVLQGAAEAGVDPNDQEAVEDGEDLEGVMELIGMQGPLAGLVQNGMFSAVLISMTVFFGIWIPYISGKLLLVFIANPISLLVKLPLRWASTIADLVIDSVVFVGAVVLFLLDSTMRWVVTPVGWFIPLVANMNRSSILSSTAWRYSHSAGARLVKMFVITGDSLSESDVPVFSIVAHESLKKIEKQTSEIVMNVAAMIMNIAIEFPRKTPSIRPSYKYHFHSIIGGFESFVGLLHTSLRDLSVVASPILKINPLRVSLEIPQRTAPLDYSLAQWDTRDRVFAVILGYAFLSVGGAVYLRISKALQENREGNKAEGVVADILYQAGGVMKVILVISIEMILFPLYCGFLLDAALLPLFENASAYSRIQFTMNSVVTSLFVHWFVGTCYMFHFALFVSMCRKIMRKGVLYFIRDPDDPTFHPVRDVLERNLTTQLRKIAFSAMVYGALVIICLGSVVWGLSFAFSGVFPIHWSSNEPVLEFPVDLLVYNFLMPVAVKFFKPSKGVKGMYNWWFRICARWLRLSHFLFGDKQNDEEGYFVYRTWRSYFFGQRAEKKPDGSSATVGHPDAFFRPNGRYVQAPNSDQVRIPRGGTTFIAVGAERDIWATRESQRQMYIVVYVPPFFRLRIMAFIFLIWIFASVTGVGMTIVPLLFGRYIFAHLIPNHLRMNDIYAFSIGLYVLGGPLYLAIRYKDRLIAATRATRSLINSSNRLSYTKFLTAGRRIAQYALLGLRLFYFYSSFTILLPSLFALVMECYAVIPLHTYFSHGAPSADRHTIHFTQAWTLGVLYIKMAGRLIFWRRRTMPGRALRAVVAAPHHGWLNPDIRLATRAFILPATVVMLTALLVPLGLGWVVTRVWFYGAGVGVGVRACVYRYSYPAVLGLVVGGVVGKEVVRALKGWRSRIRDEVYLIGERLHNFGERRNRVVGRL